ncbi:MAG: hypothetical protein JW793_15650 [Acidobacteria bacterium]|nr:hypothetical protein [Acidobacteriota bacterium]
MELIEIQYPDILSGIETPGMQKPMHPDSAGGDIGAGIVRRWIPACSAGNRNFPVIGGYLQQCADSGFSEFQAPAFYGVEFF